MTPTCPACGSPDLRHEADDRHQCRKCLWRCCIGSNGTAIDWLDIGNAGGAKTNRKVARSLRERRIGVGPACALAEVLTH